MTIDFKVLDTQHKTPSKYKPPKYKHPKMCLKQIKVLPKCIFTAMCIWCQSIKCNTSIISFPRILHKKIKFSLNGSISPNKWEKIVWTCKKDIHNNLYGPANHDLKQFWWSNLWFHQNKFQSKTIWVTKAELVFIKVYFRELYTLV